jgi:hypothetical protein
MKRNKVPAVKFLAKAAVVAWAVAGAVAPVPRRAAEAAGPDSRVFEPHWQDGKAELDGYRYRVIRYGAERMGQAVMVFVTEPFSASGHVKVDNPKKNPADTFEALKLNFVRDWQTGIYDYNTMVSVYTRSRDFSLEKISFSAMEWCGSVYEEMVFEAHRITDRLSSYFEGESGYRTYQRKDGGVEEDQLFILLRGLRGSDFLSPGESRTVPFLASCFYRRLVHREAGWSTATIRRLPARETVQVPAGRFDCDVYVVRPYGGRVGRFDVERAYPHRIIRWAWTPPAAAQGGMGRDACDSGELTGSTRLPYWQLHENGDQSYLRDLGQNPGAPVPPPMVKKR